MCYIHLLKTWCTLSLTATVIHNTFWTQLIKKTGLVEKAGRSLYYLLGATLPMFFYFNSPHLRIYSVICVYCILPRVCVISCQSSFEAVSLKTSHCVHSKKCCMDGLASCGPGFVMIHVLLCWGPFTTFWRVLTVVQYASGCCQNEKHKSKEITRRSTSRNAHFLKQSCVFLHF